MANITASTEAAAFIPEIWLQVALGRLKSYLTIQKTITKDTDLEAGAFQVGATLHLPKRGALTVNDKSENTNITLQTPTATKIDLTLNKHKEVSFMVESRAISTANQNIIQGYVEDAAIAIAEQIDTDLFTTISAATTNTPITNLSTMTEANILTARKALVDNKVPAMMPKFGIIATSQTNALLQIDRLVRYDALGIANDIANANVGAPTRIMQGSIGKLYNFEICESQLVPVTGSPLAAQNVFFAQDAVLFASRALENPDGALGVQSTVITDPDSGIAMRLLHSYQHLGLGHLITLDVLYGSVIQRGEHIQVSKSSP